MNSIQNQQIRFFTCLDNCLNDSSNNFFLSYIGLGDFSKEKFHELKFLSKRNKFINFIFLQLTKRANAKNPGSHKINRNDLIDRFRIAGILSNFQSQFINFSILKLTELFKTCDLKQINDSNISLIPSLLADLFYVRIKSNDPSNMEHFKSGVTDTLEYYFNEYNAPKDVTNNFKDHNSSLCSSLWNFSEFQNLVESLDAFTDFRSDPNIFQSCPIFRNLSLEIKTILCILGFQSILKFISNNNLFLSDFKFMIAHSCKLNQTPTQYEDYLESMILYFQDHYLDREIISSINGNIKCPYFEDVDRTYCISKIYGNTRIYQTLSTFKSNRNHQVHFQFKNSQELQHKLYNIIQNLDLKNVPDSYFKDAIEQFKLFHTQK